MKNENGWYDCPREGKITTGVCTNCLLNLNLITMASVLKELKKINEE